MIKLEVKAQGPTLGVLAKLLCLGMVGESGIPRGGVESVEMRRKAEREGSSLGHNRR